eukprot:TRINITY_DN9386_c0_g1_i1.p1 TRINITY_DN9386_c0_g1~~TRINITY_DN9386_c0_g1_i1.p1  ORF type:complete len:533 (+),score=150.64 TRINITY_DN9386_c0_g1_i1:149-1600(+)
MLRSLVGSEMCIRDRVSTQSTGTFSRVTMPSFSMADLAKNVGERFAEDTRASSDKLYIAVDNYVYDLTKFQNLHPGGRAVIRMVAGTDATEQFYALHNKEVLTKYHDKLCVGVLSQDSSSGAVDTALPVLDPEDHISLVPYAETSLMRENWANGPWWKDSHRDFLLGIRHTLKDLEAECYETENSGKLVPQELAMKFGKLGLLACSNGTSVMDVTQKLKDQGKLTFPGGLEPEDFDIWHEYISHQELGRSIPLGTRNGLTGAKGVSFLLVDRTHPRTEDGLEVKHVKTSDTKAAATAWVYFDDAYVPVENLMGEENKGFKCIMANFNHERWLICAGVIGGMRKVLEQCFLWAMQREVFGKKLMDQPVIRFKLARMVAGLEAIEGHLESITFQVQNMDPMAQMVELGGAIAILKFQTTRTFTMISDEAVQIFGGRALTASGMGKMVENLQRTFKFASVLGGSEEIMADLGIRQALITWPSDAKI